MLPPNAKDISDWKKMFKVACEEDAFGFINRINLEDVDKMIRNGFNWSKSAEGHLFWSYVSDRLQHIASLRED